MSPVALVATEVAAVAAPKKRGWGPRKPKEKLPPTVYQTVFKFIFGDYPLSGNTLAKRPKNGVVAMTREAMSLKNLLGTFIGMVLGGFVPAASYVVSHCELMGLPEWWALPKAALVYGGLLYSARTVIKWAYMAFRDAFKAIGFVVIVEGVMTFSKVPELSFFALSLLVLINAIAAGVTLSRG